MVGCAMYRKTLKYLREHEAPLLPVKVRKRRLVGCVGLCSLVYDSEWNPQHFLIELDPRQSRISIVDTLLHEWAHCLTWTYSTKVDDHSPEWGVNYARLYRAWEKL